MNHSSLAKKLKPAKRAWKSFTNNLQSKLQRLNVPKKTLKTFTHRFISFCSHRLFIPFKQRFLTKSPHRRRHNHHHHQYYYNQNLTNFAAIYIDNLYSEEPYCNNSTAHAKRAETSSRGNKEAAAADEKGLSSRKGKQSVYSIEDAWNAVVASSPQLRCVDERAEEFIYKFREDMKIQRERSLLEFQEMLARGA